MLQHIKVKVKHLAEEARIIRREESKARASYDFHKDPDAELKKLNKRLARLAVSLNNNIDLVASKEYTQEQIDRWTKKAAHAREKEKYFHYMGLYHSLHEHRVVKLRNSARSANLAYALMLGYKYSDIENNPRTKPNKDEIKRLVSTYGTQYDVDRLQTWF